MSFAELVQNQIAFYHSGQTRELAFRLASLQKLRDVVKKYEVEIYTALKNDLNKSQFEAYATEIGIVLEEIRYMMKHLKSWMKPQRVKAPLTLFGSKSYIYAEPYGVSLIIAPWNYPIQLSLVPLVGAIAAGNCAVLKPSEYAPHVSKLVKQMVEEIFEPQYVAVVEGAVEVSTALLNEPFDHIFFTGSVPVGKIVMEAAAKRLTPVILELGGKSPAIVERSANLKLAARRIIWGKCINAGQTCVAPDYLLVHETVKERLVDEMKSAIQEFYGIHPAENPDYPKIISERHYHRLVHFLQAGKVLSGGEIDEKGYKIAPTLLDGVDASSSLMEEEIFGPILPILTFSNLTEAIDKVRSMPKPLALYFFSEDQAQQERVLEALPFGGGCINDTLFHFASPYLPFGGVGSSGLGSYHGKYSFDCFSHQKSVLKQTTKFDLPMRYLSYKHGMKIIKMLLK